jgi:hypothetical protein
VTTYLHDVLGSHSVAFHGKDWYLPSNQFHYHFIHDCFIAWAPDVASIFRPQLPTAVVLSETKQSALSCSIYSGRPHWNRVHATPGALCAVSCGQLGAKSPRRWLRRPSLFRDGPSLRMEALAQTHRATSVFYRARQTTTLPPWGYVPAVPQPRFPATVWFPIGTPGLVF